MTRCSVIHHNDCVHLLSISYVDVLRHVSQHELMSFYLFCRFCRLHYRLYLNMISITANSRLLRPMAIQPENIANARLFPCF